MTIGFSETQRQRLRELGVHNARSDRHFDSTGERDRSFQLLECATVKNERLRLENFRDSSRRPQLCVLEQKLAEKLADLGFVQINSPIIMSGSSLVKMGIDEKHPLSSQIFWLEEKKKCLRPMLAPHLYAVAWELLRLWDAPVRLFEIGPCFRKESQGARHANEFTMLNLVEFGLEESMRRARLAEYAAAVLSCAGVDDYQFAIEESEVYGDTIDIVRKSDGMELASSAMGPHPLDPNWRISTTWVGIGFGLERLVMVANEDANMGRFARSLSYLDGIRLNI